MNRSTLDYVNDVLHLKLLNTKELRGYSVILKGVLDTLPENERLYVWQNLVNSLETSSQVREQYAHIGVCCVGIVNLSYYILGLLLASDDYNLLQEELHKVMESHWHDTPEYTRDKMYLSMDRVKTLIELVDVKTRMFNSNVISRLDFECCLYPFQKGDADYDINLAPSLRDSDKLMFTLNVYMPQAEKDLSIAIVRGFSEILYLIITQFYKLDVDLSKKIINTYGDEKAAFIAMSTVLILKNSPKANLLDRMALQLYQEDAQLEAKLKDLCNP